MCLLLVFDFDDAFFVGDFADAFRFVACLLKGVHGFVDVGFVHDYAQAPAHVKGFKHFLVGDGVSQVRLRFSGLRRRWGAA